MFSRISLWQRLSLAFSILILASCGLAAWLQIRASSEHEQYTIQRISKGLAQHISSHSVLMDPRGIDRPNLGKLFDMLMVVNPAIEVYLLDTQGRILAHQAPDGHVQLQQVDMAPIRQFVQGANGLILGDDPRQPHHRNVFSAAPVQVGDKTTGYIYVILQGESHLDAARTDGLNPAIRPALYVLGAVAILSLVVGWLSFGWITRPLRDLTDSVQRWSMQSDPGRNAAEPTLADGNEVQQLKGAFTGMQQRIQEQWNELVRQDQVRRELIADVSHDLRTPLTAMHGYLETLQIKGQNLSPEAREHYLTLALAQSAKVGKLARELFELARLEYGSVHVDREPFSMADLVQDVFGKTAHSAQQKNIQLVADIPQTLPAVVGDVGLIERVLSNLIDNAIRHSHTNGTTRISLAQQRGQVWVRVIDYGEGIAQGLRNILLSRPSPFSGKDLGARGGLGLLIVRRILQLHESDIEWADTPGGGATFSFALPTGSSFNQPV